MRSVQSDDLEITVGTKDCLWARWDDWIFVFSSAGEICRLLEANDISVESIKAIFLDEWQAQGVKFVEFTVVANMSFRLSLQVPIRGFGGDYSHNFTLYARIAAGASDYLLYHGEGEGKQVEKEWGGDVMMSEWPSREEGEDARCRFRNKEFAIIPLETPGVVPCAIAKAITTGFQAHIKRLSTVQEEVKARLDELIDGSVLFEQEV